MQHTDNHHGTLARASGKCLAMQDRALGKEVVNRIRRYREKGCSSNTASIAATKRGDFLDPTLPKSGRILLRRRAIIPVAPLFAWIIMYDLPEYPGAFVARLVIPPLPPPTSFSTTLRLSCTASCPLA